MNFISTLAFTLLVIFITLLTRRVTSHNKSSPLKPKQYLQKRFVNQPVTQKTGKKYLVTGASGCLGSHVVEALLERGETEVTAFDVRPSPLFQNERNVKFVVGDIRKKEDVLRACEGIDCVMHAAALVTFGSRLNSTHKLPYEINYLGTKNLVECCLEQNVKELLHVSSGAVVFTNEGDLLFKDEKVPYAEAPYICHYVETKMLAEKEALAGNGKGCLKTAAIRPGGGIFGPRDMLITRLFVESYEKNFWGFGRPEARKEWTFVRNIVHALFCLETSIQSNPNVPGKAFFIGNDEEIAFHRFLEMMAHPFKCNMIYLPHPVLMSVAYVVEALSWLTNGKLSGKLMELTPVTVHISRLDNLFDISRAKKELGYNPIHTVQEAIQKTAEFYGVSESPIWSS